MHIFVGSVLAVVTLLGGSLEAATESAEPPPTQVVLTPAARTDTAQTFTWRSDGPASTQEVVLRRADGGAAQTVVARRKGASTVRSSGTTRQAWTATATGLEPGTAYSYTVRGGGRTTARTFTTATTGLQESWSFLALGDTQVDNAGLPARIVRTAVARHPDARLVLHAGDVVNHPWERREWSDLMTALKPVRQDRNLLVSIGNHEQCVLVRSCRSGDGQAFRRSFTFPSNGVTDQRPTWFSTDYQGVRFVVLDTFGPDLERQAAFLEEVLVENTQRWTVVQMHAGPFAARGDRTNAEVARLVLPVLERHDVDLVLSGHDHSYARAHRGDPDGTVYATSVSGSKFYSTSAADWRRRGATRDAVAREVATYAVVDVSGSRLRYRSIVAAKGAGASAAPAPGQVLDAVTITRDEQGAKRVTSP